MFHAVHPALQYDNPAFHRRASRYCTRTHIDREVALEQDSEDTERMKRARYPL